MQFKFRPVMMALCVGLGVSAPTVMAQTAPQPGPAPAGPPAAAPAPSATAPGAEKGARRGRGIRAACRADVEQFCASVPARGGGRMKCLTANQAKLSPACQTAVAERAQKQAERKAQRKSENSVGRAACRADGTKLCKGQRGNARLQCLADNKAQVAPACATWVEQRLAKRAQRGQPKQ